MWLLYFILAGVEILFNSSRIRVASLTVCVLSNSVMSELFATPWTVAHQAPLSLGFSRQECWSELPFPSPEDFPDPWIELRSPALQADSLPSQPSEKLISVIISFQNSLLFSPINTINDYALAITFFLEPSKYSL